MTLQDDLARHWFEPLVPGDHAGQARPRPQPSAPFTRIEGTLAPPENVAAAQPYGAEQLEVTQPYIPAVHAEAPDFVKFLNQPPASATPPPPNAPPAVPATPQAPPAPSIATTAPQQPVSPPPQAPPKPAAQPKKRSLARRVVRRILGPDLLRKDPPRR